MPNFMTFLPGDLLYCSVFPAGTESSLGVDPDRDDGRFAHNLAAALMPPIIIFRIPCNIRATGDEAAIPGTARGVNR